MTFMNMPAGGGGGGGDFVDLTTDQTIAGRKTFTDKMQLGAHYSDIQAAVDGATVTFDLNSGNKHQVTLGGNRTLALSNISPGQTFMIRLVQDATGSRTVTWFAGIKWEGGVEPTLTTTAGKADVFAFLRTALNEYDGFIVGQDL